jgi:citrate lyase subunit beta/citryl-CoA lyase
MLFTPATETEKAKKAWKYEPDAVILDLEDTIPVPQKEAARNGAREVMDSIDQNWYVRINSFSTNMWREDLNYIFNSHLKGILVPKVEDAVQIRSIDKLLRQLEEKNRMKPNTKLIPIIETIQGLRKVSKISLSSKRIQALAFGEGDFSLDLGIDWNSSSFIISWAKAIIVVESRVAGLEKPHDGVYPKLHDLEGLKMSTIRAKELGFGCKHCIHPEQISVIKDILKPDQKTIQVSERIVTEFENALSRGNASITVGDIFVDFPVYNRAKRILEEMKKI